MEDKFPVVTDRAYVRGIKNVSTALGELKAEIDHTLEIQLSGGLIKFDVERTVGELQDIIRLVQAGRFEQFVESYPVNTGKLP